MKIIDMGNKMINSYLHFCMTCWYWYLYSGFHILLLLTSWFSNCFVFERMLTKSRYVTDENKKALNKR